MHLAGHVFETPVFSKDVSRHLHGFAAQFLGWFSTRCFRMQKMQEFSELAKPNQDVLENQGKKAICWVFQ